MKVAVTSVACDKHPLPLVIAIKGNNQESVRCRQVLRYETGETVEGLMKPGYASFQWYLLSRILIW